MSYRNKFDDRGEMAIDGDKMKFRELADIYEKRKLFVAEYHGTGTAQRKVAGVRSLKTSQHYLGVLKDHFGGSLLKNISHAEIEDFKSNRLKQKSLRGERSIADVNRTLELLRAILRFAVRGGWISRTPFEMGDPLISKADETKRERALTSAEELRLLAACDAEEARARAFHACTKKEEAKKEFRTLMGLPLESLNFVDLLELHSFTPKDAERFWERAKLEGERSLSQDI